MYDIGLHISTRLSSLLEQEDQRFDLMYSLMSAPEKAGFKQDLFYFFKVLDHEMNQEPKLVKFVHLHLIGEVAIPVLLLSEFVAIYQYLYHLQNEKDERFEGRDFFNEQMQILTNQLSKPIEAPPNVGSARRSFRIKRSEKQRIRKLVEFFKEVLNLPHAHLKSIKPRTMINLLKKDSKAALEQVFDTRKFAIEVDDSYSGPNFENRSFVVLNSDHSLDSLVEVRNEDEISILSHLENVICIDSDSRAQFQTINFAELEQLNLEGGTFKNLIVVSFDPDHFRLGKLIDRVDRIRSRFRAGKPSKNSPSSYFFLPQEWRSTKALSAPSFNEVIWVGENNTAIDDFLQIIQEREDLFELWSIKMRNVYSMAWNYRCIQLIIEDILGNNTPSCTISQSTRNVIHRLPQEVLDSIKSGLEMIMSNICSLEIHKQLLKHVSNFRQFRLIISELVIGFPELFMEIQGYLMNKKVSYETWSAVECGGNQCSIALAYRDPGKFPFSIYPNLFENPFLGDRFLGIFSTMLFEKNYLRSTAAYRKELFGKLLNHPIRREWFDWKTLIENIRFSTRIEGKEDMELWDEENAYREPGDRETITFEFEGGSQRIYSSSQQFLVYLHEDGRTGVLRGYEISAKDVENGLSIQCLDTLYEAINLFEVSPKDDDARKAIQKKYGLTSSDATTQIWKQLLRLRSSEMGEKKVYEEISEKVEAAKINLQMVSFSHFSKAWLDLDDSTLIPRSKALFKIVCTMLMLPKEYYGIMLRKRANDRLLSRKSTAKMNALLADLVKDGQFDLGNAMVLDDEVFTRYTQRHDLEDIGISEEHAATEMRALISLLRPNLNLQRVQKLNTNKE